MNETNNLELNLHISKHQKHMHKHSRINYLPSIEFSLLLWCQLKQSLSYPTEYLLIGPQSEIGRK